MGMLAGIWPSDSISTDHVAIMHLFFQGGGGGGNPREFDIMKLSQGRDFES